MRASSLMTRLGSAAILLPIVITSSWWSPWATACVIGALIVICLLEVYGVFAHAGAQPYRWFGIAIALILETAIIADSQMGMDLTAATLVLTVILGLIVALRDHQRKGVIADWALTLAGAYYIGGLASYAVLIRLINTPLHPGPLRDLGLAPGAGWLYLVCTVTWLQDALAYFVGKSYGRNLMTPQLSPKKTWEGAAGGMLGAMLGAVLAIVICGLPIPLWQGLVLGAVGGVVGPLGDLAESMIKRQAGLKDASHLIPGHGGLLDRIDSLLFTMPVLYYMILLLTR